MKSCVYLAIMRRKKNTLEVKWTPCKWKCFSMHSEELTHHKLSSCLFRKKTMRIHIYFSFLVKRTFWPERSRVRKLPPEQIHSPGLVKSFLVFQRLTEKLFLSSLHVHTCSSIWTLWPWFPALPPISAPLATDLRAELLRAWQAGRSRDGWVEGDRWGDGNASIQELDLIYGKRGPPSFLDVAVHNQEGIRRTEKNPRQLCPKMTTHHFLCSGIFPC